MKPENTLVLDAEFTGNSQELLELAVMDLTGRTVFHSYFKPARVRSWRLEPHNITPAMVADAPSFGECRAELQRLFDTSDGIVGFAVDNDIDHLRAEGVEFDPAMPVVETRELYHLYASLNADKPLSPFAIPGLSVCAGEFDIHFAESPSAADAEQPAEHSAAGDTLVTLRLYRALVERLGSLVPALAGATETQVWEYAHAAYEQARIEHFRSSAHGYLLLHSPSPGMHCIRVLSAPPRQQPAGTVACIEVADRYRAIYDFNDRFPRQSPSAPALTYRLKPKHIEFFKSYTNVYDPDSAEIYRRLIKPLLNG